MHIGVWPGSVLRSANINLRLSGQDLGGGRSITGGEQTVSTDAGFWKVDLSGVALRGRTEVLLWRAIEGMLDGRANTIDVPVCDVTRLKAGTVRVPHSDGTPFSDGSLYLSGKPVALAANVALRAGIITIATSGSIELVGGETFSVIHSDVGPRLYRIRQITAVNGNEVTARITPPFRSTAPMGASLEFAEPRCRMRLAESEGMAAELTLKRFASPSVAFVEDV